MFSVRRHLSLKTLYWSMLRKCMESMESVIDAFECERCKKTSSCRHHPADHVKRIHPKGPRPVFPCEPCGKVFLDLSTLEEHTQNMHSVNPNNLVRTSEMYVASTPLEDIPGP